MHSNFKIRISQNDEKWTSEDFVTFSRRNAYRAVPHTNVHLGAAEFHDTMTSRFSCEDVEMLGKCRQLAWLSSLRFRPRGGAISGLLGSSLSSDLGRSDGRFDCCVRVSSAFVTLRLSSFEFLAPFYLILPT
jgi:hypothetical protein